MVGNACHTSSNLWSSICRQHTGTLSILCVFLETLGIVRETLV